jgi:methionyl-tRNA synthetase
VIAEIPIIRQEVESNIETFKFREALKKAMDLARLGNKYLADTEPWKIVKTDMNRVETILNIALQISANLSIIFEPFLPFSMKKLRRMLNIDAMEWDKLGSVNLLPGGQQLPVPELLFDKIEDDVIDVQINKLQATKKSNISVAVSPEIAPQKETIQYSDFEKMDMRIATVIAAECVPKTDKLLKLTLDTGIDTRTVVSGIAEFYKPEDITGKQVCVLVNLAPRKIKGIESQGMILMAKDASGKMCLMQPSKTIDNGSETS